MPLYNITPKEQELIQNSLQTKIIKLEMEINHATKLDTIYIPTWEKRIKECHKLLKKMNKS